MSESYVNKKRLNHFVIKQETIKIIYEFYVKNQSRM